MAKGWSVRVDHVKFRQKVHKFNNIITTDLPPMLLADYRNTVVSKMYEVESLARKTIREVRTTKTGHARKAKGGRYAGRSETDSMAKAFRFDPNTGSVKRGARHYRFKIGWDRSAPEYTAFQEIGTSKIEAMNIIHLTEMQMERVVAEIKAARGGKKQDIYKYIQKNHYVQWDRSGES